MTAADPAIGRPIDKIYLIGFMTAGKTTVARLLAARLGWRAEDVDQLIEARERLTVADVFARHVIELTSVIETRRRLVVVPANDDVGRQLADAIDDEVRLRTVADEVAEHEHAVPPAGGVLEDRLERVRVGVDVGKEQVAHGVS